MPLVTDKLQDVHQPGRVYPIDWSTAFEEGMGPDEMDDQLGDPSPFRLPSLLRTLQTSRRSAVESER
jgi:hypothetical protein